MGQREKPLVEWRGGASAPLGRACRMRAVKHGLAVPGQVVLRGQRLRVEGEREWRRVRRAAGDAEQD